MPRHHCPSCSCPLEWGLLLRPRTSATFRCPRCDALLRHDRRRRWICRIGVWTYVTAGVFVLPHWWPAALWWQLAGLPLVIAIVVAIQGVELAREEPDVQAPRTA